MTAQPFSPRPLPAPHPLGLMGGTFDPIHLGHMRIAQAALGQLPLQQVVFLPDGDPPHKEPVTPGAHRLRMVKLAIREEPRFTASDMELQRQGTTYTVDTLMMFKRKAPHQRLIYLVGSDTFFLFPSWRTADKVAQLCDMAILMRPGDDPQAVAAAQEDFLQRYGLQSHLLTGRGLAISSSLVRDTLRAGGDIRGLVPEKVAAYIEQHRLYR